MRTIVAGCLAMFVSAGAFAEAVPAPETEATLTFVAPYSAIVGNTFGMSSVDSLPLVLDQRHETKLASGVRTIWYACPDEAAPSDGSRTSFAFEPGKMYELVCVAGQQATIREAENC